MIELKLKVGEGGCTQLEAQFWVGKGALVRGNGKEVKGRLATNWAVRRMEVDSIWPLTSRFTICRAEVCSCCYMYMCMHGGAVGAVEGTTLGT